VSSCCSGYPPFFSDDPLTTCRKIVNWRLFLKFPDEIKISPAAHDMISRLMCDVDERLGTNGVQVGGVEALAGDGGMQVANRQAGRQTLDIPLSQSALLSSLPHCALSPR